MSMMSKWTDNRWMIQSSDMTQAVTAWVNRGSLYSGKPIIRVVYPVSRVAMRSVMPGIISAVPRHAWCHPAHFMRIDLGLMTAPLSPQTTAAARAPGSWWLLLSPANTSLSSEIVTTQPRTQISGGTLHQANYHLHLLYGHQHHHQQCQHQNNTVIFRTFPPIYHWFVMTKTLPLPPCAT